MNYKYRVCFQLAAEGPFTEEETFLEFKSNQTGENFKLSALNKEKKFNSSNRFSVIGGPYNTVEKAQDSAEKVKIAVLYYATKQRVGIDLGKYALPGGLTKDGREMLSQQHGTPVLDDKLGITIFEAEPKPLFYSLHAKGASRRSIDSFIDTLKQIPDTFNFKSPRAELAVELYSMSHFESTSSARFLTLFMRLEALFYPLPKSEEACLHVDSLIQATNNAEIPDEDKKLLIDELSWRKKESIAQTGKRMARELLAEKEYFSMTAEKFFKKIYKTRNDLVHRGIVNRPELHSMLGEVDRYVSDILQKQFIR